MTSETTINFVVNAYWMIGIVVAIFTALLSIIWKGKGEIYDAIEKSLRPIREQLSKISDHIDSHAKDIGALQAQYGVSHSPMTPNDKGKKLLLESGFNGAYPVIKGRIFQILDEISPRTLYDVEREARIALGKLQNEPVMDKVKDYVVNHPAEPLELIFTIASWIIRDEYWASKQPIKP